MSDVVMDRKFVCTEGDRNHNKFWRIKVYSDGTLETIYGRVGDKGVTTIKNFSTESKATREAEKLIRKKQRGKNKNGKRVSVYDEIEIIGTVGADTRKAASVGKETFKKIADSDPVVESLIEFLDKQNIHNITNNTDISYDSTTGLFSTPLGVVGQSCIDDARSVLADMKKYIGKSDPDGDKLAEKFMRLIPQNIGRRRPTLSEICYNDSKFDSLNSILDSLQGSLDVLNTPNDSDGNSKELDFGVTVRILDDKKEYGRIEKYYQSSKGKHESTHLKVEEIYTIQHKKMISDWESIGSKKKPIKEMFHGSRVGNILSILSKGFFIPPSSAAHCTGRLFSNGVYFADCSSKASQYAYGTWGNKTRDNNCFMFICDVALGKTYKPNTYGLTNFPSGYDSISAYAKNTGLRYNEFVVNQINQINLKYLLKLTS